MKLGTLFAIGVGPGAPDLITLRAINILSAVPVILAASSSSQEYSRALSIARPYLKEETEIITLDFPMTRDEAILTAAWDKAAKFALHILTQGKDAAFLTLGDPSIYSTFAYLQRRLHSLQPALDIQIIPGITSFQAAAARTGLPLCTGEQSFYLISGLNPEPELANLLSANNTAAILKVYRNYPAIEKALQHTGRLDNAVVVSELGLPYESICKLPLNQKPGYMTLILSPAPGK